MKKSFVLLLFCLVLKTLKAQNTTQNFIDGGKALVELISILKNNKPGTLTQLEKNHVDSCALKKLSDLCFKNSTSLSLVISLYRRIEDGYETQPFSIKILPRKQECLYELKSGIYKYRIETDTSAVPVLRNEGEFRLQPCDNMKREIKE